MNTKTRGGKPLGVAIVDDDPAILKLLSRLIEKIEGFTVVGAYDNGTEALRAIASSPPDIVLLDLRMPGRSGSECARKLLELKEPPKLVFITGFPDLGRVAFAMQSRGSSFVAKPFTLEQLEVALNAAAQGGTYLSPTVSRMVELPPEEWEEARRKEALLAKLTPHEQDSLQLAAEGVGVKEIAEKLGCKTHTKYNTLTGIRFKTGAHSPGLLFDGPRWNRAVWPPQTLESFGRGRGR